jgi:cytochrome c5
MKTLTPTTVLALLAALALAGCNRSNEGAPPGDPTATSSVPSASSDAPALARGPSAPTPADATAVAAAPAPGAQGVPDTSSMGAASAGQAIYTQTCFACHGAGVAGAPKLGDKADWQPRIAQGNPTLYQHAIAGYTGKKGVMPPKGGNTALSDAQVRSAVDYMTAQSR